MTESSVDKVWLADESRNIISPCRYSREEGDWRLILRIGQKYGNFYGITHGGILVTYADDAMANYLIQTRKELYVTTMISYKYITPVPIYSEVVADPKIIKESSETIEMECTLTRNGKVVGISNGTYRRYKSKL